MSNNISIIRGSNLDIFYLQWSLTTWCNYRCPYCCQYEDKTKFTPEQTIINRAKKLNELLIKSGKKCVSLSLLGGEITYYNLIAVLDEFTLPICEVLIVTNFSQNLDYFKELYRYCRKREIQLQLLCSYHEIGDSFFTKYLSLLEWCVAEVYPLPVITFVMDNDFDFTIFDRFDLPKSLLNFNLKQYGPLQLTVTLTPEVQKKLDLLLENRHKWDNNKLILPYLRRRKNGQLWWTSIKEKFSISYENGDTKNIENLKDLLFMSPDIIRDKTKYCSAGLSGVYVCEDYIYRCSQLAGNPIAKLSDDELSLTRPTSNFICRAEQCNLCSNANIYKNLSDFIREMNLKEGN